MKTIEQRAEEYAIDYMNKYGLIDSARIETDVEDLPGILGNMFTAGAKSEHDEITRWHNYKEIPPKCAEVILKLRKNEDVKYEIGYYFHGWHWHDAMLYSDDSDILGWREIHENS